MSFTHRSSMGVDMVQKKWATCVSLPCLMIRGSTSYTMSVHLPALNECWMSKSSMIRYWPIWILQTARLLHCASWKSISIIQPRVILHIMHCINKIYDLQHIVWSCLCVCPMCSGLMNASKTSCSPVIFCWIWGQVCEECRKDARALATCHRANASWTKIDPWSWVNLITTSLRPNLVRIRGIIPFYGLDSC